jgi:pilus assembly protein Flp/PilA
MLQFFTRYQVWRASDEGATAVEYGVLVAVIALGLIAIATAFQGSLHTFFDGLGTQVTGITTPK